MTTSPLFSRRLTSARIVAVLALLLIPLSLEAQAPPRPTVSVRHITDIWSGAWPADFNRDGRTDLIGATRPLSGAAGAIVVRIGRGDGTFDAPIDTGRDGLTLGTGDFNGDNRVDALVSDGGRRVSILPGNGNGTFGAARLVGDLLDPVAFALSQDLNGDGHRDVVAADRLGLHIFAGNGDLTFGGATLVGTDEFAAHRGIIADLNHDSRPEILISEGYERVAVYLNRGAMSFAPRRLTVEIGMELGDVTVGDLDADSHPDIVVAASLSLGLEARPGRIHVLMGRGDGTFDPPTAHTVGVDGTQTVVVFDMNKDGHLDAVTGNHSFRNAPTCGREQHYWDSVTLLPGRGDGTFGAPATFRLDSLVDRSDFVGTHTSLKISDLNGDRRSDLITSPGAIVLNLRPVANQRPRPNAGPDLLPDGDRSVMLQVNVNEADMDWLEVEWRDSAGRVIARVPRFCLQVDATDTYTVTVRDVRGGVASDSVRVFVPAGNPPASVEVHEPSGEFPWGIGEDVGMTWSLFDEQARVRHQSVSVSFNDGQSWTRIEACAALSRTARDCQWRVTGPATTLARVRVEARDSAGQILTFGISTRFRIIARPPAGLPSPWQSADIGDVGVPGVSFQSQTIWVLRAGGADIGGTADSFHFVYQRLDGDGEISGQLGGYQDGDPGQKFGLMIRQSLTPGSRHQFMFHRPGTGIGILRRTATSGASTTTMLETGPGPHFPTYRIVRRGGTLTLWMREDSAAPFRQVGSASFPTGPVYIGMAATNHDPSRLGFVDFFRMTTSGAQDSGPTVTFVRPMAGQRVRAGEPVTISWNASDDRGIRSINVYTPDEFSLGGCFNLPGTARSCVWSNPGPGDNSARILLTAIDTAGQEIHVWSEPFIVEGPGTETQVPVGWDVYDINLSDEAGSATYSDGVFTVSGGGAALWGRRDTATFAHTRVRGNFEAIARVVSLTNGDQWDKAGLMVREDLGAGSRQASVLATPRSTRGVQFHRRAVALGNTTRTTGPAVTPPVWLRLVREGNVVTAYSRTSTTAAWTRIGAQTYASLADELLIGPVVSSHLYFIHATAVFDHVTIVAQ